MKRKSSFFLIVFTLVFFFQFKSYSQLSGPYTIGLGGNYPTINSAVNDLMTNGVSGPVTFNIKSGTYDEQVFIDSIPGASLTRNIVFQSEALSPDSVVWKSTILNRNYIIYIRNADFLTIRKLTIRDYDISNPPGQTTLLLSGNSKKISVLDNIFLYDKEFTFPVIGDSAFSTDVLVIEGNTFSGYIKYSPNNALRFNANSGFIRISDNVFSNLGNTISISDVDSILIEKNLFATLYPYIDAGIAIKATVATVSLKSPKTGFKL